MSQSTPDGGWQQYKKILARERSKINMQYKVQFKYKMIFYLIVRHGLRKNHTTKTASEQKKIGPSSNIVLLNGL
jgi:hypothetical protein